LEQLSILDPNKFKHVHFIGIGGISMSGLAEILLNLGFTVSGSDIRSSNITSKLERKELKYIQDIVRKTLKMRIS